MTADRAITRPHLSVAAAPHAALTFTLDFFVDGSSGSESPLTVSYLPGAGCTAEADSGSNGGRAPLPQFLCSPDGITFGVDQAAMFLAKLTEATRAVEEASQGDDVSAHGASAVDVAAAGVHSDAGVGATSGDVVMQVASPSTARAAATPHSGSARRPARHRYSTGSVTPALFGAAATGTPAAAAPADALPSPIVPLSHATAATAPQHAAPYTGATAATRRTGRGRRSLARTADAVTAEGFLFQASDGTG